MEPIQAMAALFPKPSAHQTAQSVFTIRQNRQVGFTPAATPAQNGLHPLFGQRIEVPYYRECLTAAP